jgi:hypothetical protein
MANRPANEASERRPAGRGLSGGIVLLLLFIVPAVFALALPTALLLLVGILPTLVVVAVDDSEQFCAVRSVGALNLCGIAPFIGELWTGSNDLAGLIAVIANVQAWLIMYGAATIGWTLYISMPPLVNVILTVRDEARITQLRELQQGLIQEWGPGVGRFVDRAMALAAHTPPPEPGAEAEAPGPISGAGP